MSDTHPASAAFAVESNFSEIPELTWKHGYAWFWLIALMITSSLLFAMRRKRWI